MNEQLVMILLDHGATDELLTSIESAHIGRELDRLVNNPRTRELRETAPISEHDLYRKYNDSGA